LAYDIFFERAALADPVGHELGQERAPQRTVDDHLPVALLQGKVPIKVDALRIPGHRAVQKQQGIGRCFFQAGESTALLDIFKIELWVCDCGHT
jgi:hypothetical protein